MLKPNLSRLNGWRDVLERLFTVVKGLQKIGPLAPSSLLVLVPTGAARYWLRVRLEDHLLQNSPLAVLPRLATMKELLEELAASSFGHVRLADELLREAVLRKVLPYAPPPPFTVRGGLSHHILDFYDHLQSNHTGEGKAIEGFAKYALTEFEDPLDAGAVRMTAQTKFLQVSLETYSRKMLDLELADPGSVREALLRVPVKIAYQRVIALGPDTLSRADVNFMARLEGLKQFEVFAPKSLTLAVASGKSPATNSLTEERRNEPLLLRPEGTEEPVFVSRDREETLSSIAKLLKIRAHASALPPLEQIAIIVPKPLPYLYLARKVFDDAGIPFQMEDNFPLASEPYVAASDLVLKVVETDARRDTCLNLLRSPFFAFTGVTSDAVIALDKLTRQYREPGGSRRWKALYRRKKAPPKQRSLPGIESSTVERHLLPALQALNDAVEQLEPLADENKNLIDKSKCLIGFLRRYGRPLDTLDHTKRKRHERARSAFLSILERMIQASQLTGDEPMGFIEFRDRLHRAVESQTFPVLTGGGGVAIVDVRSAGYGRFALVILVGLNEGEWPSRFERNIFYPQWILKKFGWESDHDRLARERATFMELVRSSGREVALFRHQIEDETPTVPSPFLEDIEIWQDSTTAHSISVPALQNFVVARSEALRRGLLASPSPKQALPPGKVYTTLARPEPVSATAFELYLRCPFQYFSRYVLKLQEEEDFDEALTPLDRGRLLHEILHEGFLMWDQGREIPRPIDSSNIDKALQLFRRIATNKIPIDEHQVELARLFGTPGQAGSMEWLLRREMTLGPLRQRLVEHGFQTPLQLQKGPRGESPWLVQIKGRVDRADIDEAGCLHIYDYKSGVAPPPRLTLQVPLYAMCLAQDQAAPVCEATYLSLRELRVAKRDDYVRASALLMETFSNILDGRFEPSPYQERLCSSCGYAGVCRKEIDDVHWASSAASPKNESNEII